jgi:hypothetical protein
MGENSRFETAYFHRTWHEVADERALEAKIESPETVWKEGESCHCEEPGATKQSLLQTKIASLRSQ